MIVPDILAVMSERPLQMTGVLLPDAVGPPVQWDEEAAKGFLALLLERIGAPTQFRSATPETLPAAADAPPDTVHDEPDLGQETAPGSDATLWHLLFAVPIESVSSDAAILSAESLEGGIIETGLRTMPVLTAPGQTLGERAEDGRTDPLLEQATMPSGGPSEPIEPPNEPTLPFVRVHALLEKAAERWSASAPLLGEQASVLTDPRQLAKWTALPMERLASGDAETPVPHIAGDGPETVEGLDAVPKLTSHSVIDWVRYAATGPRQSLTVRLTPESLGEMRIDVSRTNGELAVRLVAASPAVREAFTIQAPLLREALARQGLEVTQVVVNGDMASSQNTPGYFGSQHPPAELPVHAGLPSAYHSSQAEMTPHLQAASRHNGVFEVFA